jgi:hypothetical protein
LKSLSVNIAKKWSNDEEPDLMWHDMTWGAQQDSMQNLKHSAELLYPCFHFFYYVMLYLLQQYHHCVLVSCAFISETFEVHCSSESELKINSSVLFVLILWESFAMELSDKQLIFKCIIQCL